MARSARPAPCTLRAAPQPPAAPQPRCCCWPLSSCYSNSGHGVMRAEPYAEPYAPSAWLQRRVWGCVLCGAEGCLHWVFVRFALAGKRHAEPAAALPLLQQSADRRQESAPLDCPPLSRSPQSFIPGAPAVACGDPNPKFPGIPESWKGSERFGAAATNLGPADPKHPNLNLIQTQSNPSNPTYPRLTIPTPIHSPNEPVPPLPNPPHRRCPSP